MSRKLIVALLVFLAGLPLTGAEYSAWDHLFP